MQKMQESMPKFDQLHAFLASVRCGSFSAAARSLDCDGSVITRRVAALEERVGVQLLARTTRRMTVTEAGARYLTRIQVAFDELALAESELAATTTEVSGTLRIALPQAFGRLYVSPKLAAFMALYPAIKLDIRFSDDYKDLVAERFDVALRLGALPDSSLVARKVAAYTMRVYASPSYLKNFGIPESPSELASHQGIGFSGFSRPEMWTSDTEV